MATRTLSTLVAVFGTEPEARSAADDLRANGFDSSDIQITAAGAHPTAVDSSREHEYRHHEGGIKGWFKSLMGENDDERVYEGTATRYEGAVSGGNVLLSVEANDDKIDLAADVLNRHSPIDVHREASEPTAVADAAATRSGARSKAKEKTATEGGAIPVMREELQVGKRTILSGGVRVFSRVVEEPVEEKLRLRQETVRVDRTPVNREVTDADLQRGQEKVVEVKEYTEEPVVSKSARVVEEVRVHKDSTERDETIRDTVRHTEVEVENLGERDVRGATPGRRAAADAVREGETGLNSGDRYDIYENDFRRDFDQRYANSGEGYDTYAPAYRYGYEMANDPRYRGRSFDEVESSLRDDYSARYPGGAWQRMKDSVRYGWDRLTNRR